MLTNDEKKSEYISEALIITKAGTRMPQNNSRTSNTTKKKKKRNEEKIKGMTSIGNSRIKFKTNNNNKKRKKTLQKLPFYLKKKKKRRKSKGKTR